MKFRILIRRAVHVKGSCRAVLYALESYADRNGTNAFPSQDTLADACGYCVRTVRRALRWLEDHGIIVRTGGRRSRRGRAVIVWKIVADALSKPDIMAGRPDKHLQKKQARQEKMGREAAFRILAARYGWGTLQKWSEQAIDQALDRIVNRSSGPCRV